MKRYLRAVNLIFLALNLTLAVLAVISGRWVDGTIPLFTAFICGTAYVLLSDSIEQERNQSK